MKTLRVIILAIVAIFILVPVFGLPQYWLYTLTIGLYYAMLASSWSLLVGYVGRISFAQAAMSGLGAYVSALVGAHFGLPVIPAILLGVVAAALFGLLVGLLTLRLHGAYLGLTTIAFAEILRITVTAEHQFTQGSRGMQVPPLVADAGPVTYYYIFLAATIASILIMLALLGSRIGLFFQSIREDEDGTASLGVNVTFWKAVAFSISTAFAGLAGGLYAHFVQLIAPSMMSVQEMGYVLAMAVIGGFSNVVYAALGGVILQVLLEALREFGEWRLVMFGAIAILMLRFAPNGIFGLLEATLKRRTK